MIMNLLTLYDVMPENFTSAFLSEMTGGDWLNDETVDVSKVDVAYIYGHSGNKYISPFLERFLDDDNKLTSANIEAVAEMLWQIFGESWNRLWEINKAEFDPLENYNRTEERDTDESGKETMDRTHTGSDTSVTTGLQNDNKSNNKVYGFNSANGVNASENASSHKSTNTFTPGVADKEEKSFTDRNTHQEIHAYGNIGTLTSQQMAQSSLDLWKWKFWMQVMDDLDSWLCCSVY